MGVYVRDSEEICVFLDRVVAEFRVSGDAEGLIRGVEEAKGFLREVDFRLRVHERYAGRVSGTFWRGRRKGW
jgi:hypothetical protein